MIYPIYVDTKQPQQASGGRRVSKSVGLEWPLAEQMAKACRMIGYETVFEVRETSFLPTSLEKRERLTMFFWFEFSKAFEMSSERLGKPWKD